MRSSDWSSDGCSSDLRAEPELGFRCLLRSQSPQKRTDSKRPGQAEERLVRSAPNATAVGSYWTRRNLDRCAMTPMVPSPALTASRTYDGQRRSEEPKSEFQSLMRTSYAVFCLKKKTKYNNEQAHHRPT